MHIVAAIFVYFACLAFSLPNIQNNKPRPVDNHSGRWNLTIENDLWRVAMPADLRAQNDGILRLVLLGPVSGEDGLFTGRMTGNEATLDGKYNHDKARMNLVFGSDKLNGKLSGGNWNATITGERIPVIQPEIPKNKYEGLFDAVCNGVRLFHYDPNLNGVDWLSVRARNLDRVKSAGNDGDLAVAIRTALRELAGPGAEFFLSAAEPVKIFKTDRVIWKEAAPEIGYLIINRFSAEELKAFDGLLDRALDELGRYPSLIIDLRGNNGENLESALLALNFLLPDARSVAYFATRDGMKRLGVTSMDKIDSSSLPASFIDNTIGVGKFQGSGMYLAGGKYKRPYRGRVVILTDGGCSGSCELFAAAMQEAKAAVLIGRQTRGSMPIGSTVTFNIKGWMMRIPMTDIRTAAGRRIEGKGIEPDLAVEGYGDAALDRAIDWLKEKRERETRENNENRE